MAKGQLKSAGMKAGNFAAKQTSAELLMPIRPKKRLLSHLSSIKTGKVQRQAWRKESSWFRFHNNFTSNLQFSDGIIIEHGLLLVIVLKIKVRDCVYISIKMAEVKKKIYLDNLCQGG